MLRTPTAVAILEDFKFHSRVRLVHSSVAPVLSCEVERFFTGNNWGQPVNLKNILNQINDHARSLDLAYVSSPESVHLALNRFISFSRSDPLLISGHSLTPLIKKTKTVYVTSLV